MTDIESVELPLLAGTHPNGQPVIERVAAQQIAAPQNEAQGRTDSMRFRLLRSPLFVAGVAAGDEIRLLRNQPGQFRVLQRSGQLAVRVMSRDDVTRIAQELTPEVELAGGRLDLETPRALVYSLHFGVGFREIEALFDRHVKRYADSGWNYGNVYDDQGQPLAWWEDLLKL